jgi:dolichyl-phosphate beta-glucosyltransferase
MSASAPRVSLVLPCYNGGSYVRHSLATLFAWLGARTATLGSVEVILVDDGSADDTVALATATGLPFTCLRHERNRGKGAAVRTGMRAARGEFRIFMDADMPFELDVVERMLHYLDFKEFDVCVGSRTSGSDTYAIPRPFSRRLASLIFAEFVGRLVVTGVRDTQCGLKGFRAAAADYLFREARVDRFAFDIELLYLAFKAGFDVKAIPVRISGNGPSTLRVTRDGLPMLLDVMRLPIRYHRGVYRRYDPPRPAGS